MSLIIKKIENGFNEFIVGEEKGLDVWVTNNGKRKVSNYRVAVYNEEESQLYCSSRGDIEPDETLRTTVRFKIGKSGIRKLKFCILDSQLDIIYEMFSTYVWFDEKENMEPYGNDSWRNAQRIYNDENILGEVDDRRDVDWYVISFNKSGLADFEVTPSHEELNVDIAVYKSSDLKNSIGSSAKGDGLSDLVRVNVKKNRDYYIKIQHIGNIPSGSSGDEYWLRCKVYQWDIPSVLRLTGSSSAEKSLKAKIDSLNYKIRTDSAQRYWNAAIKQNCLPSKYKTVDDVVADLLWDQHKINRVWEKAEEFSGEFNTVIDPRMLICVVLHEGTGSFNTNTKPKASDGGGYIQPDFEKDLEVAFTSHILGKIITYTHYVEDFKAAVKEGKRKYSNLRGNGSAFQYVNYNVPRLRWVESKGRYEIGTGCYAKHAYWWEGLKGHFDVLVSNGATDEYSDFLFKNPIPWPINAVPKPKIVFSSNMSGTDSKGNGSYPVVVGTIK